MGLVNRVVPDAELDSYVDNYCRMIGENAPLTMHAAKRTIEELTRLDGEPDFARLTGLVKECFDSEDYIEGRTRVHGKAPAAIQGTLTMKTLTQEQYDAFWRDGYLMVEDAVTPSQLAALQAEIAGWVEESRAHQTPFGPPTIDGRPRFDMGAEHRPRSRRCAGSTTRRTFPTPTATSCSTRARSTWWPTWSGRTSSSTTARST